MGDMTDRTEQETAKKRRQADVKSDERQDRLAKALRENLRRRKAQLRGKRDQAAEEAGQRTDQED